ncbi:hypothetical protein [Kingella kingae]
MQNYKVLLPMTVVLIIKRKTVVIFLFLQHNLQGLKIMKKSLAVAALLSLFVAACGGEKTVQTQQAVASAASAVVAETASAASAAEASMTEAASSAQAAMTEAASTVQATAEEAASTVEAVAASAASAVAK